MESRIIFILFFLLFFQQPVFTAEITLNKSFYQPGETITIEVEIQNYTAAKECLKSLDIIVSDPNKVLCSIPNTYAVDTECVESGGNTLYTFTCFLPLNTPEGVGAVEVRVETWNAVEVYGKEFFEIGVNYAPAITVLNYPDIINPSQEYTLSFSVYDNFGVEDLVSADVILAHQGTRPSEREYTIFTWEPPDPYTVWETGSPLHVEASVQNSEIVWTLTFSLSEIASPGEWRLEILVYDTAHQHHQVVEQVYVTKYLSFHLQDTYRSASATINFGRAEPGEDLPRVTLTMVVTSNAPVNILVQGDDLYSGEGAVLPADIFSVETSAGTVQLSRSRQVLYTDYVERDGFNREARIRLIFYGKLPEVIEAGTYSGVWYIIVEAV